MHKRLLNKIILFEILLFAFNSPVKAQLQFGSLDSLYSYAEKNSVVIKSGSQQSLLAKWTKITALANTINLRAPLSFAMTDNTQLAVNFLPAEAFGGMPGSFREVTLGQQYISSYGLTPQIDIINPAFWAKVKSAELNKQLTEINNTMAKRNLYESIAACYYNIISLGEQIKLTEQSLLNADSVLKLIENKFKAGIVREQDNNNAKINQLLVQDKLLQLKESLQQQSNSLKILCDISSSTSIIITENSLNINPDLTNLTANSTLPEKQVQLQSRFLKSEYASTNMSFAPIVSVIFNQGWQQNSNHKFFDNNARWIPTQYIGLRITAPLPDASKLSQSYSSKINWIISEMNLAHTALQNKLTNEQTNMDYKKAVSAYSTNKTISGLKAINYKKSLNQYKEGILSTDLFLTSFSDRLNAQLNEISALMNLKFIQTKINLNNKIQ